MVENSLGRLWLEGHPDETLQAKWKYYIPEAKQDEAVEEKLIALREERKKLNPEDLTFLDPCMGSGHILAYAFDLLMDIYRASGRDDRSAVESIRHQPKFQRAQRHYQQDVLRESGNQ